MRIGNLTIEYDRKFKKVKFIHVSFLKEHIKNGENELERLLLDDWDIVDQYQAHEGVTFFLAKF